MIDTHDFEVLDNWEDKIEKSVTHLAKLYNEETDLELLLLQELKKHPEITASVPHHQYVQLRKRTHDPQVEKLVDDYLRKLNEVKVAKLTYKQIVGKRDSEKKKYNQRPI